MDDKTKKKIENKEQNQNCISLTSIPNYPFFFELRKEKSPSLKELILNPIEDSAIRNIGNQEITDIDIDYLEIWLESIYTLLTTFIESLSLHKERLKESRVLNALIILFNRSLRMLKELG